MNRRCKSCEISANSTTVIHCNLGGHGTFMIRLNTSFVSNLFQARVEHMGAFVCVNGPLIDTIFLTWSDLDLAWVGEYNSCLQCNYSGVVYIYMHSFPDAEAVPRSESCLSHLFFTPFMFPWAELAPSTENCSSPWLWADLFPGDLAGELSLFSPCPPRADYVQAFTNADSLCRLGSTRAKTTDEPIYSNLFVWGFTDSQSHEFNHSSDRTPSL